MRRLFWVGIALLSSVSVWARNRRAEQERREALRWLERSLAAQEAVETATGRGRLMFSAAMDPTEAVTQIRIDSIRYRRVPSDTVCGYWFAAEFVDRDAKNFRIIYNGEAEYAVEEGENVMEAMPAESAKHSLLFLNEWHDRIGMLRASLAMSDSAFRQHMKRRFNDVGRVWLDGDTVIDGRRCRVVRNEKCDTLPQFRVWFRRSELFAFDRRTALPVYQRSRLERRQRGKTTTDQLIEQRIDDFQLGVPLNDSVFRSPGLPLKKRVEPAEVGDSSFVAWNAGADVLGRWPGRIFSDSTLRGRFVAMDFSYKGCGFCQLALPVFDSVARSFAGNERVQFLMLDPVDKREAVVEYARTKGISYPVLSIDERLAAAFGLNGYPAFVILGPNGKVCFLLKGFPGRKRLAEILGSELKRLLAE